MPKRSLIVTLFFSIIIVSCQTSHLNTSDYSKVYELAIEEAMSPTPNKVSNKLIQINSLNNNLIRKTVDGQEYILVVTWKNDTSYYKPNAKGFYNTGDYPIWITTAPQLLNRMRKENAKDVNLRLKQLLGLPPNSVYNYFIEFWVNPGPRPFSAMP